MSYTCVDDGSSYFASPSKLLATRGWFRLSGLHVVHEHHHIVNLQALPALSVGHHDRTDAIKTSRAFCGRLSIHHLGKTTYVALGFRSALPWGTVGCDT